MPPHHPRAARGVCLTAAQASQAGTDRPRAFTAATARLAAHRLASRHAHRADLSSHRRPHLPPTPLLGPTPAPPLYMVCCTNNYHIPPMLSQLRGAKSDSCVFGVLGKPIGSGQQKFFAKIILKAGGHSLYRSLFQAE